MSGRAMDVPRRYEPSYTAAPRSIGNRKSRTNDSRRSTMCTAPAPVFFALSRTVISSSPCPRSAQKATTSQRYFSMSQRRMTEVSSPPEYARTTFFASGIVEGASQQLEDHGLLRVQPVLGLVEHDGARAVQHRVGDLLAAVRGQAVHDDRGGPGEAHQRVVELVAAERLPPLLALGLLPHAHPHVGIEDVGAGRGVLGVGGQLQAPAQLADRRHHARVGLVAGRARHDHGDAEQRAGQHQRVADVVAVADPGQPGLGQVDAALPQREVVRQRLARVLEIAEPVDDRHRRVAGQAFHGRMRVHARGDPVDPAREVARDVGHRLARAQPDLVAGEIDGPAAELDDADLERHARAQGLLLEDQRERSAVQRRRPAPGLPPVLEVGRQREEPEEALPREVVDREQVLHFASRPSTSPMISSARRHSAGSTTSGGARRSTFSPAVSVSSPASRQASMTGPAGLPSSMPMSSPLPRTSLMIGSFLPSSRRPSISSPPRWASRSGSLSPMTVVSMASATEVTNAEPAKVEPWEPAVSTEATCSRQSMAPMGMPLASALASVMTSGSTPECW